MQTVREENDAAHEELAFKESELEESKLEYEVEKQQLKSELSKARAYFKQSHKNGQNSDASLDILNTLSFGSDTSGPAAEGDQSKKKLKEELESVKEQLIETEKKMKDQEDGNQERVAKLKQTHQSL